MDSLLSVLGCLALPVGAVIVVLIAIWIIRLIRQDSKKYNQERQEKASNLREKGITAPAVIISAKNGIVQGANNNQRMHVTFKVDVQPEGRSSFQTTFKDWVGISQYAKFVVGTERTEDVGKKIWVTYNPNDIKEIMFEYYDKDRKYMVGRPAFEKIEKRNQEIRKTGEEALAVILEAEDLELTNVVERDHLQQTIMRLKLEITPKSGQPYQAETQALFSNSSLRKYEVGKKVYVKFNPQDNSQVTLLRSAEG